MKRAEAVFIQSVVVILIVTAFAKLVSATRDVRALGLEDPLLMLSNRHVLILVGMLELAVATFLLSSRRKSFAVPIIAWLAVMFTVYRLGLHWIGVTKPCSCLGTIASTLGITAGTADLWMKGMLAYLVLGSVLFLTMRAFIISEAGVSNRPAPGFPSKLGNALSHRDSEVKSTG